ALKTKYPAWDYGPLPDNTPRYTKENTGTGYDNGEVI
ncbi:unnamed protein product, partial [marine sediment metagenome]